MTYQSGPEGNLKDPIKNLKWLGMKYQELSAKEIEQELPFKNLPSKFEGLWAPDNGCINVQLVLRKLADLCRKYGVEIVEYARVRKITALKYDTVNVEAECNNASGDHLEWKTYNAAKCAITVLVGAYTNHILEPSFQIKLNLEIWEMVYAYYA